jgi:hypothetical protein
MEAFANESHKAKSSNSIDQDNIEALEARIKVIIGVDLYDLVRLIEMCLVPNIVEQNAHDSPQILLQ